MNTLLSFKRPASISGFQKGFPLIFLAFLSGIVFFYLIKCNVIEMAVKLHDFEDFKLGYSGCAFAFLLALSASFSVLGFLLIPLINVVLGFAITGIYNYVLSSLIDGGIAAELIAVFALTYLCVFLTIVFSINGIAFSSDLISGIKADKLLRGQLLKTLLLFIIFSVALISECLFMPGIR